MEVRAPCQISVTEESKLASAAEFNWQHNHSQLTWIMPRPQPQPLQVHECSFEATIHRIQAEIKFPCKLFVAWKTNTNTFISRTRNEALTLKDNAAQVEENLLCQTHLLFNPKTSQYQPKLTSLCLYLISDRKPNEEKMVGRVTVNLAQVLNSSAYSQLQTIKLEYSSARNGYLEFAIQSLGVNNTDLRQEDLDPEDFNSSIANSRIMSSQSLLKQENPQAKNSLKQLPSVSEIQENNKLITVIDQLKKDLENSEKEKADLVNEVRTLESKITQIQNDIVQELLNQVREETEKRISIENKMKEKLLKKEEEFEDSERRRLEFQSEVLQLRFELSEIKADMQSQDQILQQKQVQLERLLRELQFIKKNFKIDASISELSNQSHLFSNKEREGFLHEIQKLQYKLQSTTDKLEGGEEAKQRVEELEAALKGISEEKQRYFEEIKALQKENFKLEQENKDLEDKVMKTGDSIMMDEVVERLTSLQGQFDQLKEKLDILESENAELLEETRKMEIESQQFYNSARQLEDWQQAKKDINYRFQALLEEKTSVQNEFSQTKILLSEKQKILEGILSQLKVITDEKKSLQTEFRRIQAENKKLESQVKYSKISKEEDQREKDHMENEVIELNKVRAELSGKNVRLQNEMKSYELKMEKTRREFQLKELSLKESFAQYDQLQHRMNEQIRKAQTLESKMTKLAEKQIQMKEDVLILEEQLGKIFDILMEKEDIEANNLERIQILNKQLNQTKIEVFDVKQKLFYAEEENSSLKTTIFELKKNALGEDEKPESQLQEESLSREIQSQIVKGELNRYKDLYKLQQVRIVQLEREIKNRLTDLTSEIHSLTEKTLKLEKQKEELLINKLEPLEKEKVGFKAKCGEFEDQIRRMEHVVKEKQEKLMLLEESHRINQVSQEKLLQNKSEENQKLIKRLANMEKSIQKYEQKIDEQKQLLDEALGKLQKREFELYESERGKFSGKKSNNKKSKNQNFDTPQPLSPPSSQKNLALVAKPDVLMISKSLKELIQQRRSKQSTELIIQTLLNSKGSLEQNLQKLTLDRGIIQENARKLSMEFAKIKAQVLKGKGNPQQKKQFLHSLKPCEEKVKQLVSLAENLSNAAADFPDMED